ncbi:MAG: PAS domain S-box protein [Deltaproteobacteria bacterium]|nr:PAS domain S-box protein [Deltaproteobacteria bacterium]
MLTAKLGMLLATVQGNVTPIWPPAGIALAAVLLWGPRLAPAVALGTLVATLATGAPWQFNLAACLGNTAAALAGLWLLRWRKIEISLARVRDVISLMLWGALAASIVSATVGTLGLLWAGMVTWPQWGGPWLVWWLGDSMGVAVATPVILYWFTRPEVRLSRIRPWEPPLWLLCAIVFIALLFGSLYSGGLSHMLCFLAFPLLLWAALRFGSLLTSACALVMCYAIVIATARGEGPFAEHLVYGGMVLLWVYLGSLVVTSLALAVAMGQARDAADRLSRHRDQLAQAVERRTAQLVSSHQELLQSHQRNQEILEGISDGFFALDRDMVFTHFNAAAERLVNRRAQEVLGLSFADAFPEAAGSFLERQYRQALEDQQPRSFETFFEQEPYRNWFDVRIYPSENGISVFFRVTTAEKEAELALARSEERLRTLVEESPLGVAVIGPQGEYLYTNPQFTSIFGYQREETPQGRAWFNKAFPDPQYRREVIEVWNRDLTASQVGQVRPRTFRVTCKNGEVKTIEFRPVTLSTGEQLVVYEDVSERENALKALKASEERFQKLYMASPVWMNMSTIKDGRILEVNEAFHRVTGYSREETINHTSEELGLWIDPQEREGIRKILEREGSLRDYPVAYKMKDGQIRHFLLSAEQVEVGGEPSLVSALLDVTDLNRAQKALKDSERRFRSVVENSLSGIYVVQDGKLVYVNPRLVSLLGHSEARELLGREPWDSVHPEDLEMVKSGGWLRQHLDVAQRHYSFRAIRGDGTTVWLDALDTHIMYQGRKASLGNVVDITQRKAAEEALKQSEEQYRLLVNNAQDAIFILQDGLFVFANPEVERVTGYTQDELKNVDFKKIIHPDHLAVVAQRYSERMAGKKAPNDYPMRIVSRGGRERWIQVKGTRITWKGRPALLYTARDITRQRAMESKLRQSQKLEAVGTLAGGIAHDFNNMLAAIMGYAELSLDSARRGSELAENLEQILKAGERGRGLVQQILNFSKGAEREIEHLDLGAMVSEALKLLRAAIPSNIKIETDLSACGPVLGDPIQLHQVLVNLVTNAAQAMEETGGVVELSLQSIEVTSEYARQIPGLMSGPYVRLVVSDTGPGIPQELRHRIFEPFFTTKETGKGSGLGLAAVHGIVQSHMGAIILEDRPDLGTSFVVLLPEAQGVETSSEKLPTSDNPTGSERVMFVDDEASLVEVSGNILRRLGYQVSTFSSSTEALAAFKVDPTAFDLVITDQTMPGLTGAALTQEIKALRPDIPVIITSGFSHQLSAETASEMGVHAFVLKPITSREIARVVRLALDASTQPMPKMT